MDQQAGCSGYVLVPQVPHQRREVPTLKPLTVTAKRLQGHSPAYRVNSRLEEAARLKSAIHLLRSHSTAAPCRVFGWYGLVSALQVGLDVIAV